MGLSVSPRHTDMLYRLNNTMGSAGCPFTGENECL